MCELGLGSVARNVRVLDVERSVVEAADAAAAAAGLSSPRVGSVDVLDALRASFPSVEKWSWVLGSDAASDLHAGRWKDGDRLLSLVHLYVVERPGHNGVPGGPNATPLRLPALEGVSSTAVRCSLAEGRQADAAAMLDTRVAEHIASHGLY
jgi:nicotinic acid mononucleotide adenylyltransferase